MSAARSSSILQDPSERSLATATGFPQTAGVMTRLAYEHAHKAGLPVSLLARRAGLTPRVIQDWSVKLDAPDQAAFLVSVAASLDDDLLGFHLAQHADFRAAGLLFYVLASSSRLIEVFQRGARYTSLVNEGVTQRCIDGRFVGLELRAASAAYPLNAHEVEFWITALLRLSRQLTGKRLAPERVCFTHTRRRRAGELSRYFSCDVEYDAAHDSIVFAAGVRDLSILNADPFLNRLLVDHCEEAMQRQRRRRPAFQSAVENALATLLPHGEGTAKAVARRLGVSQRTLARKLAAEGSGFSRLRTHLRRELAQRYLKDPQLSIAQIAWLVGFRDTAAFSHAFKRWTGRAPRHARGRSAIGVHAKQRRQQAHTRFA